MADGPARDAQRAAFAEVMAALGAGGPPPGLRAARSVLRALDAPPRTR
jgi:lipid-A-disaccharide synthase